MHLMIPAITIKVALAGFKASGLDANLFEAHWGMPVHLGQQHSGFRLSDEAWGMKNQSADPLPKETLRTIAEQAEIKQFTEAPLIYAIRTRLPGHIEMGKFSAEDIAAALGLSKRTLQRQLATEKMAFRELLDLYRQEQAMLMLQSGKRNMMEVACAPDYNELCSLVERLSVGPGLHHHPGFVQADNQFTKLRLRKKDRRGRGSLSCTEFSFPVRIPYQNLFMSLAT
ncbi:MAG: hypothetical protein AAF702_41460 [Chloroflexota bacterium]